MKKKAMRIYKDCMATVSRFLIERPVLPLLIFSAILFLWEIDWGLPNSESWLSDSLAPFYPLLGLSKGFSGYLSKYPPVHQILLAILNLPVVVGAFAEIAATEGMQLFDIIHVLKRPGYATLLIYIDRLVSAAMGVGTVYGVYLCGRELFSKRAGLFAGLVLMMNTQVVFYAHLSKVELPYLFWAVMALYQMIRAVRDNKRSAFFLSALFMTLSYGTKDQGYALFVLPVIIYYMGMQLKRYIHGDTDQRKAILTNLVIFGTSFIVFTVLTQNLILNWEGFVYRFQKLTGWNYKRSVSYTMNIEGIIGLFTGTIRSMQSQMGIQFFLSGIAGCILVFFPKYRRENKLSLLLLPLIVSVSYYLFFVQVIRQTSVRFAMPQAMMFALYGGIFFDHCVRKADQYGRTLLRVAGVALFFLFLWGTYQPLSVIMTMQNDIRYEAEAWMNTHMEENVTIEYYAYLHYLPRFPEGTTSYRVKNRYDKLDEREPDYIVLTSHYYPRFMGKINTEASGGKINTTAKSRQFKESPAGDYLEKLFKGERRYTLAAEFHERKRWYNRVTFSRISPDHVYIYKKTRPSRDKDENP